MAKVVKEYDVRKAELLDAALALFTRKGYEHTSVADIIGAVGIAKGTFYHYFTTKDGLLDELIGRFSDRIYGHLQEIVDSPTLNATDKLNTFFVDAGNYKAANKETVKLAAVLMVQDQNTKLRQGMLASYIQRAAPLLSTIVGQGIAEGLFTNAYPDLVPHLILHMGLYLRDEFARAFIAGDTSRETVDAMVRKYTMYQDAMERVLGASSGSIRFVTPDLIQEFFGDTATTEGRQA